MKRFLPLDVGRARTYPLATRPSRVSHADLAVAHRPGSSVKHFLDSLPHFLAADDLRAVTRAIASRVRDGRVVVLGMGAHPIKVGLSPLIIDLMERGIVHAVALNGAAIVHDFELSYQGTTSEDVAAQLRDGRFGMAHETGEFLNEAIRRGAHDAVGLGASVGRAISAAKLAHGHLSILAAAHRLEIPATVHVAIGTDIIHMHPSANGAALGQTSLADFRLLGGVIARMNHGVFINLGSAVVIPETFLKGLNLARNLGHTVEDLITVDMDFLRQYRPRVNVVQRPTLGTGHGYELTGHHEIMFPLVCAAITEALAAPPEP
jgi:deoxyhypusine synthase